MIISSYIYYQIYKSENESIVSYRDNLHDYYINEYFIVNYQRISVTLETN